MTTPLPGAVNQPNQPLSSSDSPNTMQGVRRQSNSRLITPQASFTQQARLQLTSSTLGSDGRPTPPTNVQQQQQEAAFSEQQSGPIHESRLNVSRSTLGQTEREMLIEAVLQYQELLARLGHEQEAQNISAPLVAAARRTQRRLSMRPSSLVVPVDDQITSGLDVLLKDGFVAFLEKVIPHLPPLPQQVVKFSNVNYTSQIRRTAKGYATVGSKLVDCFAPCLKDKAPVEEFHILEDCTGYLMPGTLTLVLGPPGCGKSSFHQVLAGRAWTDKTTKLTGSVTYNQKPVQEVQYRRLATYIGQTDKHLPTLSVRETCDFARDCTTGALVTEESHRQEVDKLAGPFGKHMKTEVIINLMGLGRAGDTRIGDRVRRGVSGGERHRVTTAEMLCGTYVAFFFDEISTGLDSSATYDIVSAIRTLARTFQTTNLFSLLQPAPEVFDLFDRLVLLDEGRIVYQGPREDVLPYFAKLGYFKPKHVDVADFLQEVTTEAGRVFLRPGHRALDSRGFAAAYKSSELFTETKRVVESPELVREVGLFGSRPLGLNLQDGTTPAAFPTVAAIDESGSLAAVSFVSTDKAQPGDAVTAVTGPSGSLDYLALKSDVITAADVSNAIESSVDPVRLIVQRPVKMELGSEWATFLSREYVQPVWENTKTVFRRQFKVAARNTAFTYARLFQVLMLGVLTGTVFYQMSDNPTHTDMDLRKSVSFIAVLAMALGAMAQIPNQLDERVVFYKHHGARFFRAKSYAMALVTAGIPFSFMEIAVYCPLVYFLTGLSLQTNGAHFFIFLLIVFVAALFGSALVRLLAAISPSREAAGGLSGLLVILLLLFSGFLIVKSQIPPWWIWMYYINPLQYAYTAIVLNEFLSGTYDYPCSDPRVNIATAQFCRGKPDVSVAEAYLDIYKFPKGFGQVWLGVGVLLVFYVALTMLTFYVMDRVRFPEVKNPPAARTAPVEDTDQQEPAPAAIEAASNGTGGSSTKGRGVATEAGGDVELGELAARGSAPGNASGLAFLPITLSFHDLVYEIDIPGFKDPRILLNYVSGYAKPGTMTALMGSSGAGKTTLLDVLAGRKTTGRIRGDILINGYPKVQETFARVMGYCEQNDIHTPFATVYESLLFSAHLRLPKTTAAAQRVQFVKEVMDLLELWPIANDLVGFIGSGGLSVEQAKRLTIGVELVSNPSVLFLDEPTSGLDSRAAQRVITGIQNIVATGRSVICTIHQPSRRLFLAFDNLLLLKRGGEVTFFGELGFESKKLLAYFESLPGVPRCGDNQNPATFMLEVIGAGIGHDASRDFAIDYKNSDLAADNYEELERLRWSAGNAGPNITAKGYAAEWGVIARHVLLRMQTTYWRNVSYSFGRLMFAIILGVLLGSIFWQAKYDTTAGIASRTGMIYISVVFYSIINANNVIPQVNAERPLFYREKAAQMYPSALYSISWGAAEIPYLALSTLVFCAIAMSMVDVAMTSASDFFAFWFLFFEYAASITFFGLMLAHATPNAETAAIIIPLVINVWNIVSGFTIPKNKIPIFWRWLYYLSPTAYTLNGLLSIAFFCDTSTPQCAIPGCNNDPALCPACTCPRIVNQGNAITWTSLSKSASLDYGKRFRDMGILLAFIVAFRVLAFLALLFIKHNKR